MDKFTGVLIRSAMASMAVLCQTGCTADSTSIAGEAGSGDVVNSVEAITRDCRHSPRHPHCQHHACGDGVVDPGEACDDGNREDGDGCSAQCQLDDVASTPGDDRAGYVWCSQSVQDLTCGPDLGCCAQPNPGGPACAAERTECGQNPTFQACDGPEDCADDLPCVGTRFGNTCAAQGYYRLCHTDADCERSRPDCDEEGICREKCGDGEVGSNEECDDGNHDDGDGCSAACKLDDITATPGDDRAGYVACGAQAPDLTCGPGQGCCTQTHDSEGKPQGPLCAADRNDCPVVPSFDACDGPEDCEDGVDCMGTRFGNVCGNGYYRVCHRDADCESSRPACDPNGTCVPVY